MPALSVLYNFQPVFDANFPYFLLLCVCDMEVLIYIDEHGLFVKFSVRLLASFPICQLLSFYGQFGLVSFTSYTF